MGKNKSKEFGGVNICALQEGKNIMGGGGG
jgi:hypothetical protein